MDPYERPTFKQIINYLNQLDNNGKEFIMDKKVLRVIYVCSKSLDSHNLFYLLAEGLSDQTNSFLDNKVEWR